MRRLVDPVAEPSPRTERSPVSTAARVVSVDGEVSSDARQTRSTTREEIGDLYLQMVNDEDRQESCRLQIKSTEAEIAQLHGQLEAQRQELNGVDERVRRLRTQMRVLVHQANRGAS